LLFTVWTVRNNMDETPAVLAQKNLRHTAT